MSYDSSNLTTPDIKWLGVRPSDLNRFNIPQQCRLPMTDDDIKMGKKLVVSCLLPLPDIYNNKEDVALYGLNLNGRAFAKAKLIKLAENKRLAISHAEEVDKVRTNGRSLRCQLVADGGGLYQGKS